MAAVTFDAVIQRVMTWNMAFKKVYLYLWSQMTLVRLSSQTQKTNFLSWQICGRILAGERQVLGGDKEFHGPPGHVCQMECFSSQKGREH
jgi:hypothetical protein